MSDIALGAGTAHWRGPFRTAVIVPKFSGRGGALKRRRSDVISTQEHLLTHIPQCRVSSRSPTTGHDSEKQLAGQQELELSLGAVFFPRPLEGGLS